MKTYMMEIKELKFSYGFKKPDIFSDFSLTLQPGAVYGLLGKNGTGKSTLLYLMCGLLRPKSGSVTFCGSEMSRRQPSALQEIFIVPEEFTLPAVTLAQYVKYNAQFYPRFSNEILNNCLRDFEMDGNLRLNELSMGQKKKAFMSFALATNTRLLLMDEPTNGFDIPSKSQMRKVKRQTAARQQLRHAGIQAPFHRPTDVGTHRRSHLCAAVTSRQQRNLCQPLRRRERNQS